MWYPEEPITYCRHCDVEIPVDCIWRGHGLIISAGRRRRTSVLYSMCPECGQRLSVGLDGPWWYRTWYSWLWQLRYPRTRPPRLKFQSVETPRRAEPPRRRASGG